MCLAKQDVLSDNDVGSIQRQKHRAFCNLVRCLFVALCAFHSGQLLDCSQQIAIFCWVGKGPDTPLLSSNLVRCRSGAVCMSYRQFA